MVQIAGGVVYNPKLGVVVVSQNHDSWSLPKGHIEIGETPLEGAKREVHEETGIPESALTLVREVAGYERGRIVRNAHIEAEMRHITLFFFTTDWEVLAPIDPINPEALWMKPEDVHSKLSHPIDKKEFERIIALGIFQ